jgi:hypothetical protein
MKVHRLDKAIVEALNMDASESIFTETQLKELDTRLFETKFPDIRFRDFLPIKNVASHKQTYSYKMYTMYGLAKWIANYADDLPRVGVKAVEYFRKIRGFGTSYGWSFQEMRAAAAENEPLEDTEARAARRATEEFFDSVAREGDSSLDLLGLLNQTNTTSYTVPNGVSGSAEWEDKTPDEIVADMHGIANNIVRSTKEVEKPDTLLLPTEQFTLISSKRMGDGDSTTILEHFLKSNPYIKNVASWHHLAGAGAGDTDRMVCYKRDPMNIEFVIGQEFETFPPQQKNLGILVNCHARTGGVVVRYPLSMSYGDGI